MTTMASPQATMSDTGMHPSPQRARVGFVPLMLGLVSPPAAWSINLLVNYWLSSYPCSTTGLSKSGFWIGALLINVIGILVALGTTYLSYRNWHAVRGEHPGDADDVAEIGEGRARFIGLAGAISGIGFIVALIFDLIAILGVPQCAG